MDNPSTSQDQSQTQPQTTPIGQMKVDIFSLDKDISGLMVKLKNDREALTKTFEQNRSAVRLLADLFSESKGIGMDFSRFEQAGIDVSQVLKNKITEQASLIDRIANENGIKSNLAEQFTHYDDRHTGAEAKNELLEDIETQLMSTIYNKINELRGKIDGEPVPAEPAPQPVQQNNNQFTVDNQPKK